MTHTTLLQILNSHHKKYPDRIWLRDRKGDDFTEWSFAEAHAEINAAAAWLEQRYGASRSNIAILSRNSAHWLLADLAIMASGNVSIPLFTTLVASTTEYILFSTSLMPGC